MHRMVWVCTFTRPGMHSLPCASSVSFAVAPSGSALRGPTKTKRPPLMPIAASSIGVAKASAINVQPVTSKS